MVLRREVVDVDEPAVVGGDPSLVAEGERVDVAVALQLRRKPLAKWWGRHRRDAAQLLSLYLIGAVGAAAASDSPLTLAFFVTPSALVLLGLRNTARLQARTKQAAHALARSRASSLSSRTTDTLNGADSPAPISRGVAR